MAEIYTQDEIIQKIKDLDTQIETAQSVSEYELDTGQGRQRVRRQSLTQLLQLRDYWNTKLEQLRNSSCGIMSGEFFR